MNLTAPLKELNVMRESSQLCRAVQKSGEDVVREILAEPVRFRTRVGSSRVTATHHFIAP
jgi:hypothetical protein